MYSNEKLHDLKLKLAQRIHYYTENPAPLVVSNGNSKIGKTLNVSNAPGITCINCSGCIKYCYDIKACIQYPNVLDARAKNTALLFYNMPAYFKQLWIIMSKCKKNKFLRFHVSGDIINQRHLNYIVQTAMIFPDWQIWTYTKNYDLINEYFTINQYNTIQEAFPSNLVIMFSKWQGMPMINPYGLPEFQCRMPGEGKWLYAKMYKCPGNCDICKASKRGCIYGENVYTDLH